MSKNIIQFEGIGTKWWIEIFDEIADRDFQSLEVAIKTCVSDFENRYSRFLSTSLIAKLNHEKHLKNPPEELINIIQLGLDTNNITEGHFNIAVGSVLEDAGYDQKYSFTLKDRVSKGAEDSFSNSIKVEKNKVTINKDSRIDLGGIGKGVLIDKIKKIILDFNIKYFFINAGGDIYATSNHENPIKFYLENPFDSNQMIGEIEIKNQSIASSSPSRRRWKDPKTLKEFHHLIDMKSKEKVDNVVAVFTLGKTATEADIASTAIFVSSLNLHQKIGKYFNVEYLVVLQNKSYFKSVGYSAILYA